MPAVDRDTRRLARGVILAEAEALRLVAGRLDEGLELVVDCLEQCAGRIAITGVGKCADIGRKIAATMNSTGTRAYFLDAVAARHGDLGMVHPDDVALVLSHSGESDEVLRLLDPLRQLAGGILAITSSQRSSLARGCDRVIAYGSIREAVQRCRDRGLDVSHAHVRYLNPLPRNLGELLARFDRVLVPELNSGQLVKMIRSQYLVPAESLPKMQGQPFKIAELEEKIRQIMES